MSEQPLEHLPQCQPVRVNFIGVPGPPHAGWQCVAECPVYRARMAQFCQPAGATDEP